MSVDNDVAASDLCVTLERRALADTDIAIGSYRVPAGSFRLKSGDNIIIGHASGLNGRLRGECNLGAGWWRGLVLPRMIGTVAPETAALFRNDDAMRGIGLWIPQATAALLLPDAPFINRGDFGGVHTAPFAETFLADLMDRMWRHSDDGGHASRLFLESAAMTLLASLDLRACAQPYRAGSGTGGLAMWQVRRATERIADMLSESISLEELAASVNLSPFHFSRAFKRSTGLPPHRYQLMLRIEKAKELLSTTQMSIAEVALAVGYDSPRALARLFARELKVSPNAFRRSN